MVKSVGFSFFGDIHQKEITRTGHYAENAESAILYEQKEVFFENTSKTKTYSYTDLYRIENEGDIFELKPKIRMHEQE